MNQPEQDQVVNALGWLGTASFEKLPAAVKPIGAHTDDRRIIGIFGLGLLPRQAGELRTAIDCWSEAPCKDGTRLALANLRRRPLEQPGELADAQTA